MHGITSETIREVSRSNFTNFQPLLAFLMGHIPTKLHRSAVFKILCGQTDAHTHTHTDRQTPAKTIPACSIAGAQVYLINSITSYFWCLYCYLHQLRQVVRSVLTDAAEAVVHAFTSSRLDYCNSLLYGISDILFRRLQAVHIAAAGLVTGA